MTRIRSTRRAYYNLFSHLYDALISLHARRDAGDTRNLLVKMERKRVIRTNGVILIMEHEVPHHPLVKHRFNLRMLAMDAFYSM